MKAIEEIDEFSEESVKFHRTILSLTDVSSTEKIILGLIITLSENKKCTISNWGIEKAVGVKKGTVGSAIHNLVKLGYIECSYFYDPQVQAKKRWVKITEKTLNLITKKPTFMEEVKEEVAPGIEDSYEGYNYDIKALIKKLEAEEYGF
jgi:DNA-binding MarR family transcriptional regulator